MKKYLILLLFVLLGCASRKVDNKKTENKETIKIDSTAKIVEEIKSIILTKKDIEKNEFNYEPIDTKDKFIIDGKTYRNVRISHKKESDNTIVKEDRKESKKQDVVVKKKEELKGKEMIKKIDKKANYFIYLWFLLIPLFYLIYNRFFKNKTFFF